MSSIIPNLLMVQSLGLYTTDTWKYPAWSISVEFWTYLVFAALCCTGRRSQLVGSAACVVVGCAVVVLAGKGMTVTHDFGFFRGLFGFFTGYFAYRLWSARFRIPPRWLGRCELPILVGVVLFIVYAGGNAWLEIWGPLVFAAAVLVFAGEGGAVSRILRARPIGLLGAWSYSIYMVHAGIITLAIYLTVAAERVLHTQLRMSDPLYSDTWLISIAHNAYVGDALYPIYLAVIFAVSSLTYRWIERPGRAFFNAAAIRWRAVQPAE